jgi:TPR repeat protein
MPTAIDHKEILRLYEALNERVLAKDSKGTLQVYDELLRLGQPLSEIMAHGLRALNDPPDDVGEAFSGRADATVLDEPPLDHTRSEPSQGSIADGTGLRSERALAPNAFGEAPRFAGDAGNHLPSPDPATVAPDARPQPPRGAMAPLSPIARRGLVACAVAVLAVSGVLLMQPAAQEAMPGAPVNEAPVRVRAEISSTAAAAPRATGASASMAALDGSSPTGPRPAPPPAAALSVTAPPSAEPAPSAQPVPETPAREAVAAAPPAVAAPAPKIPPEQQRQADAEIAALLARGDSLVRAGTAVIAPAPDAAVPAPAVGAPAPAAAPTALAVVPPDPPAPAVAPPAPKIPSDQPRLTAAEVAGLLARGDSLLGVGDIASARLFYERASDAGNGRAALRLGATYDPGFLDRVHLPHLQSDAVQALSWYRRARDLGESEADLWIRALETKSGR